MSLPLATIGDDGLLAILAEFVAMAAPGLDLPAERGLSGKVVRRFGGVSCGKSGGMIGCGVARTRGPGPGELGLDMGPEPRPLEDNARAEGEDVAEGVGLLRVGVDDLETGRMAEEVEWPEVGVDGLEFCDGRLVLSLEAVVVDGRVLEGVEARAVDGLAVDEERLVGVDGLMYDDTEAELVFRILGFLLVYCVVEIDERVAEPLLAGFEGWILSD